MTLAKLKLLPLTAARLPAVVELDKLCLGGLWTLAGYERELASPNSELLVISVPAISQTSQHQNEQIVGIGCYWQILEEAHLTILAVHPDYQGLGFGKLLLCALLADAVQRGLERATLEVRASNTVALSLYKKFGFTEAGRRRGYYKDTNEDALILWRSGLAYPEFTVELAQWKQEIEACLQSNNWQLSNSKK
ncbi:MAG: ribosomal protein S18-alanine N-acetyltransferase [Oscillatoria sp. PMC 1068.18]|nr:ribosomal protein S18-alanine N-acetyltransferase [Oscillatoria sp. PMC 1076.18]MEC4988090.1 ribosomal protein S18-alanine N-acetyltransferase [Oscillatoria sp. PMC 1068.18]